MVDADAVRDYLDGALVNENFFIDSVFVQKAGKRSLLAIAIDSLHPLTLDDIAKASRVIDGLLEDADVVGQSSFTLEVSSRGVDAPLLKPHHFVHNVARLVKVKLTSGLEQIVRIQSANEDAFTTVDGDVIEYKMIESAFVQIEFNRKSNDED